MNISKIKDIKNIDAFSSFKWNGPNFKKYNLIYGWNGCGKTTVSRILSFLEMKKIHLPEFSKVEFQIQTDMGLVKEDSQELGNLSIKVFNEDFINDNLSFHESKAKKILIIGKENIYAQKEIVDLESKLLNVTGEFKKSRDELGKIGTAEGILTEAGTEVVKQFANTPLSTGAYSGRGYNKIKVDVTMKNEKISKENLESFIIEKIQDIDSKKDVVKNQRQKITTEFETLKNTSALYEQANQLLDKTVNVLEIEELKEDKLLRNWTEVGYHLHTDRGLTNCQFCKKSLDINFLSNLSSFFTDELEKAKKEIDEIIIKIDKPENKGEVPFIESGKLFPDLATEYIVKIDAIKDRARELRGSISTLVNSLNDRRENIHDKKKTILKIPYPETVINEANIYIESLNSILKIQNERIDKIDESTRAIEVHTIATILKQRDYFLKKEKIQKLEDKIKSFRLEIETYGNEISKRRASILNASVAIDGINNILKDYFGEAHIYLELTDASAHEVGYVMKRRQKDAKHLSEGEKSIIALIYFLAKLDEDGFKREDGIIVIDDPVDSQDEVFLFRTFGLIKRQLVNVNQLIILTHSFSFFNLIRDWMLDTKMAELYLMTCYRTASVQDTTVDELPEIIKKYKSEYQFLFFQLYNFNKNNKGIDEPLVSNIARKLLEYFASFKWSCATDQSFSDMVHGLYVKDTNSKNKGVADFIVKFLHEHSHGLDFTRPITSSTLEAKDVARNILEFIHMSDPEHYKKLKALSESNVT